MARIFRLMSWEKMFIFLIVLLLFTFPIIFVVETLNFPYPLEYRDAAVVSAARDISQGINYYRLYTYPDHIYLYGFLYPLMMAPFVNLVKHPILVARWIDVIFLVLFLAISYDIFRIRKASMNSSLIGVLILFNSTCLIWKINGSRPDITGLFFAILAVYVLMKRGFGLINIILSAAIAVSSFYFKQYMLFTVPVIALYLFLFISKKSGLIFGIAASVLLLVSFLLAWQVMPLLFEYTFLHHVVAERNEPANLIREARNFFRYFWPLVYVFIYVSIKGMATFLAERGSKLKLDFISLDKPLAQEIAISLVDTGILVSTLLLIFVLGGHLGNTYTYFGELLLPFLVYSTLPSLDRWITEKGVLVAVQFVIVLFAIFPFSPKFNVEFDKYRQDFGNLYITAGACEEIYDISPLIAMYKIENELYPVYSNGQRRFADSIIPEQGGVVEKLSRIPEGALEGRLSEWNRMVSEKNQDKSFDCIFSDSEHSIDDIPGYEKVEAFDSLRDRQVFLWVPAGPH